MTEITLERTHALLEKLAEYVMTQVPTRRELDERFEQIDKRFEQIDATIHGIHSQLDLIRTEQRVFAKTFELHHKRLELVEKASSGYRVRDAGGAKK
ncbi:hypothetical protein JW998_11130 [candidate division KSB1 bacterium]|nr:hypothetical protein [candidate division KSB1 bacterium]